MPHAWSPRYIDSARRRQSSTTPAELARCGGVDNVD
jgi:hypothetical protein